MKGSLAKDKSFPSSKKKISFVVAFLFTFCPIIKICWMLLENITYSSPNDLNVGSKMSPKVEPFYSLLPKAGTPERIFHFSRWETHFFQQVCFHCIISWYIKNAFYWQQNYNIYVFNTYKAACYYLLHPSETKRYQETECLLYYLCVTEGPHQCRATGQQH